MKEINKEELQGKQQVSKNHKFLHESVNKEIIYYKDNSTEKEYISYFNKVFFEISKFDSRPKEFDFIACFFSNINKEVKDEEISLNLRGTKTLKISEVNCYDNTDIKVVFSENGFSFIEKFGNQFIKFERIYISFLLAHAYNLYIEKLMIDVSKSYTNNNLKKMIDLRKEIYIFDLNCYFFNPINYKNHQQHTIWNYLNRIYYVDNNHKEMKAQIEDLVNLIEIENKENEKKEREIKKNEEERYHRELLEKEKERDRLIQLERQKENKKSTTRTNILTLIGVLFAAFSIGSVYADLVDLGALPNIFQKK